MRDIFNMDGPLFVFLSKVADLLILNLLFLLCCIPIFTIGASLTGLSYVTLRMREGEDGYIAKSFFKSFKQNFKQATGIWLILLAMLIVLILDFQIGRNTEGTMGSAVIVVTLVAGIFWLMEVFNAFTLLARFENTIFGTMKNALLVAMGNAPKTLLMLLVLVGAIFLTLYNGTTLSWGILIWLMFGFSGLSMINSSLQYKIIHKLMPESDVETEEPDHWSVPDELGEEAEQKEDKTAEDRDFLKYV